MDGDLWRTTSENGFMDLQTEYWNFPPEEKLKWKIGGKRNGRIKKEITWRAKRTGLTEELKAANQIEWVQRMNSIQERAEEIVRSDFVYK
mgnify:CR=1 FL=1